MPPADTVGGTTFSTSTLSSNGFNLLAADTSCDIVVRYLVASDPNHNRKREREVR